MGARFKARILIAGMMLNFAQCMTLFYGNLLPYMYSVFYAHPSDKGPDIDAAWMLGIYFVSYVFGAMAVDLVRKNLGLALTTALGILVFDAGMCLSYLAVQSSVWSTSITLTAMGGVGTGLLESCVVLYVAGWFSNNVGLVSSLALTSNCVGGMVFNVVTTAYINPNGLTPDSIEGHISFFSQQDIIDRVPMAFVLIGCMSAFLHVSGFCLMKTPPTKQFHHDKSIAREDSTSDCSILGDTKFTDSAESEPRLNAKNKDHLISKKDASKSFDYESIIDVDDKKFDDSNKRIESEKIISSASEEMASHLNERSKDQLVSKTDLPPCQVPTDKTPVQVLKSEMFYYISLAIGAEAFANNVVENYYKIFGFLWISDDSFFAFIGSTASLVTIVFQIGIGHLIDILGVRELLAIYLTTNALFLCFLYFTPLVSRWLYFAFCNILLGSLTSQFVLFPLVTLKLFGAVHFPTNLSLVLTTSVLVYFISPPLINLILSHFGWCWMFIISGVAFITPMVLIVCRGHN